MCSWGKDHSLSTFSSALIIKINYEYRYWLMNIIMPRAELLRQEKSRNFIYTITSFPVTFLLHVQFSMAVLSSQRSSSRPANRVLT